MSVQIPPHEVKCNLVKPKLWETGKIYAGSYRYGDYVYDSQKKWWLYDVNGAGIATLRNETDYLPTHRQVTEEQLRTCFTLVEERTGGRIAFKALPKEVKA